MTKRARRAAAHLHVAGDGGTSALAHDELRSPSSSAAPAGPTLAMAWVDAFEPAPPGRPASARRARVRLGAWIADATVDAAVDDAVLHTARIRRERVLVQRDGAELVVLGALRTAATPGVDEGDEFHIRARRVAITAAHELSFATGAASLVLRAVGHVETLAQDITSRASGVHKLVGRLIRLN
jgi:hypothetical protein